MKNLKRIALLIAIISVLCANAAGQKRNTKHGADKPGPAPSDGPKSICAGEAIPKGFVIVGEKSFGGCGGRLELTVKKPSDSEIVCEDSPIPAGFTVMRQQSSEVCQKENVNPLANALMIQLDGVLSPPPRSSDRESSATALEMPRASDEELERRAENARRASRRMVENLGQGRPPSGQIDDAIRQRRVIIGMNKGEVLRAIGRPTSVTTVTRASGVVFEQWYYRRFQGSLFFDGEILESMVED